MCASLSPTAWRFVTNRAAQVVEPDVFARLRHSVVNPCPLQRRVPPAMHQVRRGVRSPRSGRKDRVVPFDGCPDVAQFGLPRSQFDHQRWWHLDPPLAVLRLFHWLRLRLEVRTLIAGDIFKQTALERGAPNRAPRVEKSVPMSKGGLAARVTSAEGAAYVGYGRRLAVQDNPRHDDRRRCKTSTRHRFVTPSLHIEAVQRKPALSLVTLQTEDMNDGNATGTPRFPSPTRMACLVARATPDSTPVGFRLADIDGNTRNHRGRASIHRDPLPAVRSAHEP